MNLISVPVALMAGVCAYVGGYYLLFYSRRRDPENLMFALTSLCIALYDAFCVGLYNSTSYQNGMFWQRLQFASLSLFSISVAWFIYHLTKYRRRLPFLFATVWFAALFILGLSVRSTLTLSLEKPMPKIIRLGGLANITYFEVDPGPIYTVQYVSMIILALFILFVMLSYYRDGNRRQSLPILLSLLVFFFAVLNDALVGMGAYPFIYLLEYTYMLIVASMAYVLMNSFVDLHHEVEELNTRLEEKINERTMDLLFRDMGTELYLRLLGELSANACEIPGAGSIERLISGRASNSLSSLSHDIGVISNTDELLNRTVSRAVDILEAEGGCLYLAGEGKDIELRASKSGRSGSTAMKPIAELAFTGRQAVNTVMRAEGGGECHVLCVPVMSGETAIGACCIENPASARGFTDNDARLLSAFMRQAAVAIGNALLYRKVKTGEKPARAHAITPLIEEKIKKAIAYIEENYTSDISRENLAASLNMHPDTLGRYFKLYTDKKISEYAAELRVRDVAARLREPGGGNIIDLAFAAGFESLATFNRTFQKVMKASPTEYRERHQKGPSRGH